MSAIAVGSEPSVPAALLVVAFPLLWCLVAWLLSHMGGWSRLAQVYKYEGPFEGTSHNFQSAHVGKVSYSSCLTISTNDTGLYLVPFALFGLFHPALLIPWSDISVQKRKVFFMTSYRLTFSRCHGVTITIAERTFNKLVDYFDQGD